MTIALPDEIRTCKESFRVLGEVYAESCWHEDIAVEFDCAGLRFVDANLCAALGVVFEQIIANGKHIKITGKIKQEVSEILRCNNFLPWVNKSDTITLPDPEELEFSDKLFFPYWNYGVHEAKSFVKGYARKLIANKWMPIMTDGVRAKMIESLGELFNNVKVHAESTHGVFVCGKYSPKRQALAFTISDAGIGFRERLSRDWRFRGSATDAIDWALTPRNTVKNTNEPGGLGLKILNEFIWLNDGRMVIVSDSGYYELSHRKVVREEFKFPFPGTVVSLEVNAADTQSYSLKTESVNNGGQTNANSNN